MSVTIIDSVSKSVFAFDYVDSTYRSSMSANVSSVPSQRADLYSKYWGGTEGNTGSFTGYCFAETATALVKKIETLKAFLKPQSGSIAPSILLLKYFNFPMVNIILTSVDSTYEMVPYADQLQNKKGVNLPYRATVGISFYEIANEYQGAFVQIK